MIDRIDTLCLKVRNVEDASNWYQQILGFKETFQDKGYRILAVGNGSVPLTIEEGETNPSAHQCYPIFFSSELNQTYENLKQQGVKVSELQFDGVNSFFDLYDLDNNKLQICFWSEV
ncbi:VOC family protein [Bacillus sp. 2205SS5-2]|uniref:VOC family protein n=1 Tax=Bacillus sp. 2205SS5-2 TaxID=3109031 RepID=UPI003007E098